MVKLWWQIVGTVGAISTVAGCAPRGSDLSEIQGPPSISEAYTLGPGDKLQIILYGAGDAAPPGNAAENPLAQYVVSETGTVDVPYIGAIEASGLTVNQLKQEITHKLAAGYINDPKVGIEVSSYRPFYIVGEVNHPGAYPCTARSRVLSAVALAGGFTYRANEDFAIVERKEGDKIVTGRLSPDAPVMPDDVIRISERYY